MQKIVKNLAVKIVITTIITLFSGVLSAQENDSTDLTLCEKVALEARSGDLIFTAVDSYSYRKIAADTLTWSSHIGIIFKEEAQWVVYESRIPRSTITPLCDFIGRSMEEMVEVKRFNKPLARKTIKILETAAFDRLGYYYHTGFDYDNKNRMFCSKYVFDVFQEAGIDVGLIETLEELLNRNPEADLVFWTRWYLGSIPWERRTVTPASQIKDDKFITVFENNVGTGNSQIPRINASMGAR